METLLVECVQSNLRLFMHRNAIFLCERLCAEFPSELNLQLLASCYLHNNQAYCAYHILKGTQMAQSRYLFAISCFQMDLLREAEAALCPANEPNAEVPNGAAGHYLLGLIYRYTDRRESAVDHFMQALSIDPFLWVAYEELCILGAAEEANGVFGVAAALRFQQQNLHSEPSSRNSLTGSEDGSIPPSRTLGSDDMSLKQVKQLHGNNLRDIPGHPHSAVAAAGAAIQTTNSSHNMSLYNTPSPVPVQLSGVAPPPLFRNVPPNLSTQGGEGSPRSTVNAAMQPPRRKFMDEGKLRKSLRSSSARAAYSQVSGRLFSDSAPRRSTRLAGEAAANSNSNAPQIGGNGTNHTSTKFLGTFRERDSSKVSSATFRSVTVRKGQSWATESLDEGRRPEALDDARSDNTAILSRYGVHSFPTIFIANRTSMMRHYGSKDLSSLRLFYKRITGLQPVEFSTEDQPSCLGSEKSTHVWDISPREILTREPYLVFSLLFLCLKAFIYFFPDMLSHLKAIWVTYSWHLSLGFFGDTSQLLEHVLHVINVKKAWSKLRRCKTGNFQNGAKNARVWASSLASVSLGESSLTRSALLDS